MARLARITVPGLPHHVTQRGNGRQRVFYSGADYMLYRDLLVTHCRSADVEIWAWCLMPNHVHLLLVPNDENALRNALSKVHRIYAGIIHTREKKSGHFWQGRFGSVVLDEDHLLNAFLYVALNPVRARLVANVADWPWASTRSYFSGENDGVTLRAPMLSRFPDMQSLLAASPVIDDNAFDKLRQAETIGRPLGKGEFLQSLADKLGRDFVPGKPGPKRKEIEPN